MFGLYLASIPDFHRDWAEHYQWIEHNLAWMFPHNPDWFRQTVTLGCWFILLGILLSPWLQRCLSCRIFRWLGEMSFALYLLHGTLIRTVGVWVAYGRIFPQVDSETGEVIRPYAASSSRVWCGVIVVWALLLGLGRLWVRYVERFCALLVRRFEMWALKTDFEPSLLPVEEKVDDLVVRMATGGDELPLRYESFA